MDDKSLAKWLREELPRRIARREEFQRSIGKGEIAHDYAVEVATALLALLREADDHLRYARTDLDAFLTRLRAVLGTQP